ncbi:MAG: CoA-transferase subunit beta, partial [Dehalococcoidia bacterium]
PSDPDAPFWRDIAPAHFPVVGQVIAEPRNFNPTVDMITVRAVYTDGEVVFQGVNSVLPMVAVNLAKRLHAPNMVYINIAGGIDPGPRFLPESSTDPELARGSASIFSNEDFYDLAARGGVDTLFLGAVQVDASGRTNVSVIGDHQRPKVRLPGGGGAAVLMPTARRVIVWRSRHDRRAVVERLDFVTATGNVDRVVTPLCLFQRRDGCLQVESIHPGVTPQQVVANTGFPLAVLADCPLTPPPTPQELQVLDEIDPKRVRELEFR